MIPAFLAGPAVRLIAVGLLAAAAVGYHLYAVSSARSAGHTAGKNEIQVKWDKDRLASMALRDAELADRINESDRRIKEHAEIANEEHAKRVAAEALAQELRQLLEAAGARVSAAQRRLRDALATSDLVARAGIGDPATAAKCAPAFEAADLRGRLLQRFDDLAARIEERIGDAAGTVGNHADDTYSNGSECARRYDALIKKPS